jgi:glutathione reductase (NADPH)
MLMISLRIKLHFRSNPPIGTVGLSEEAARKKYDEVHIYRTSFRAMKHTLTGRQEKTLMKLVVDAKSDKVCCCVFPGSQNM